MVTPTPGLGAIPVFTPVPVQTDAFGNPIAPTPVPPAATDAFGNPIAPTPALPVATDAFGNPIQPLPGAVPTDAFGNPIPPTPFNPTSPLAAPFPGPVPTDAFGNPVPTPIPQPTTFSQTSPLATPGAPAAAAAVFDAYGNPIGTPLQAAALATDAYGNLLPDQMANAPQPDGSAVPEYAQPVTPTAAYVVVTATPTEAPVALAPVLTPLPTATPLPAGVQLASSLQPGGQNLTQNLMIMLLCLTFTGASAIGIIGLITSVMFMRSRSSQRDFYERTSIRRRY
jgi:hypothetical protein